MHILLSSHYALPHMGGVEVVSDQLARMWHDAGHQVTHVASSAGQTSATPRPWTRVHLPAMNMLETYAIPYPVFNPLRLRKTLQTLLPSVDVINIQGILYQNNVTLAGMAQGAGVPVVLTEYPGIVPYSNPLINWLEHRAFDVLARYTAQCSDHFIYHNREVEASLRHYFKSSTTSEQIKVGVDVERFKPATPAHREALRKKWGFERPTALFIGRRTLRKGGHWLSQLGDDSFDVVVCGPGQTGDDASPNRMLGYVNDTELIELYQASDAFLLFTTGRDFPLVGLEAMACGLPVVLFDYSANREYHDTTTAVFVDEDAAAIRDGLRALFEDRERWERVSASARDRAVEAFSWETIGQRYLSLFERLAGGDTGPTVSSGSQVS